MSIELRLAQVGKARGDQNIGVRRHHRRQIRRTDRRHVVGQKLDIALRRLAVVSGGRDDAVGDACRDAGGALRCERQTAAAAEVVLHRPAQRRQFGLGERRAGIGRFAGERLSDQIRAENSSRDHVQRIMHAVRRLDHKRSPPPRGRAADNIPARGSRKSARRWCSPSYARLGNCRSANFPAPSSRRRGRAFVDSDRREATSWQA